MGSSWTTNADVSQVGMLAANTHLSVWTYTLVALAAAASAMRGRERARLAFE